MTKKLLLFLTPLLLLGFGCSSDNTQPETYSATPQEQAPPQPSQEQQLAEQVQIDAQTQAAGSDTLTFDTITSPEPGWLAVYKTLNGQPNLQPEGYVALEQGENATVSVSLSSSTVAGDMYIAIVHQDTATSGTFEFPEADPPLPMKGILVEIQ